MPNTDPTPEEVLAIVDPTRAHENDQSFPHWYILNGELVNIYAPNNIDPSEQDEFGIWYIRTTEDPVTGDEVQELWNKFFPDSIDLQEPGYWYIKETVDPVTGEVEKELTNQALPEIDMDDVGIWYIKDGVLDQYNFPDLAEYGAWYTNIKQQKAIIFPNVLEIGEYAFAKTSMNIVYLNPECKRYSTSFPPECIVKDWPLEMSITTMPTKTTYSIGEDFDITGMKVAVVLDMSVMGKDYSSWIYTANNTKFTVVEFDNTTAGEKEVKLKYCNKYNLSVTVTVTDS